LLALVQPVWSRVDEAWHADVLAQYADGVYPVLGVTTIRPEILHEMEATGVFRWDSFTSPPPDPALATFGPPPRDLTVFERGVWVRRHIWQYSYEALQPPLYYLVAEPFWRLSFDLGGIRAAIYSVRLLNALLAGLLAPLTLLLAGQVFPGRRDIAVAGAILAAAVPGFALNASQISNDTLATVLGSVCLLIAARGIRGGWPVRRAAWLGLAFGAGMMAKPTVLALAPALAYSVLWPPAGVAQRVGRALVSALAASLVAAPWLLVNLAIYGSPTTCPACQTLNSATVPWQVGPVYLVLNLTHVFVTFWSGDQLPYTVRWAWPIAALLVPLTALAAAGAVRRFRNRDGRAALLLPVLAASGAVAMALALPIASHNDFYSPGRYAYPALTAVALLLSAGLLTELRGRRGQVAVGVVVTAAAGVVLAYGILGPAPKPGTPTHPPATAMVRALSGHGERSGFSIQIEEMRAGPAGVWVRVSAVNASSQVIEWSPMPHVSVDGEPVAVGVYSASDPFPEDVTPGQSISGWIRLNGDEARLRSAARLTFLFIEVAANGYHDVGDLSVIVGG
jgi:hypothetical protein